MIITITSTATSSIIYLRGTIVEALGNYSYVVIVIKYGIPVVIEIEFGVLQPIYEP